MTNTIILTLISLAAFTLILAVLFSPKKKKFNNILPLPDNDREQLEKHVPFYIGLDKEKRLAFETRMQHFLSTTRITGVNTKVERLDEILIAASAIIPIFEFSNWEYINLNEVLLYPDSFNEKFEQDGAERSALGVVGEGAYQNVMILSQHELRQGFLNETAKTNTAIHEFVHLVDKTDGAVDGIPEALISKQYVLPWLQLMQRSIENIKNDESDINSYGATNQAEFFAVASEYFFERPDLFEEKHPELYALLRKFFKPDVKK